MTQETDTFPSAVGSPHRGAVVTPQEYHVARRARGTFGGNARLGMMIRLWLGISLLANLILGASLLLRSTSKPTYDIGVLAHDVEVHTFQEPPLVFVLPQGLTVANLAPRGIAAADQFEPYRFSIVVSSDRNDLVNYESVVGGSQFGHLYSADYAPAEREQTHRQPGPP